LLTNEARIGLRELERDLQASRTVYESFLVRSRETGEQERLDTKNVRVISHADVPQRRSWPPSYALIALSAMLLGTSAGTGLAFLREIGRPAARASDSSEADAGRADVDRVDAGRTVVGRPVVGRADAADPAAPLDLPLLASLPPIDARHPLRAFEDPKSRPATEIRKLHDALRGGRKRWAGQSILLLASERGSEAAAVAFNLALVAAANHSVLLIDADISGKGVSGASAQSQAGLMDVASGEKLLSEAVTRDPQTNINLLPLFGQTTARYRDIQDARIKSAFDQTKRYDLVIVVATTHDSDPVGLFFAALVDQIALVGRQGAAHRHALDDAVATLESDAQKVRGTVLTNAKA
jgi:polysaccharide biosynthesis transport protein